jgi:uncharacterized protein
MVAGLMAIPELMRAEGVPPSWSGYVGVDDVDAEAERVKGAGGAIKRPPTDIPNIGRFAVVSDPGGAVFLLFKPNTEGEPKPVAPMTPGHIGWHELMAGDLDREFAFYSRLFGWTKDRAHDMGPMGSYQTFATGGAPCGGMMKACAQTPHPLGIITSLSTTWRKLPTVPRRAAARSSTAPWKSLAARGSFRRAIPRALLSRW